MAGTHLDARVSCPGAVRRPTLRLPAGSSRNRRLHGTFSLGDLVASVFSSRRDREGRVALVLGRRGIRVEGAIAPSCALELAHALETAAIAARSWNDDSIHSSERGAA